MADIRTPPSAPGTWGEAFAALPAETPPRDGWQRVSRQLATRRRARLPAWAGLAAAAGLLLALGLWTGLRPLAPTPASPTAAPGPRVASQPARRASATPDATPDPATGAIDGDTVASPATRPPATATRVAATQDPSTNAATAMTTTPENALAPLQQESAHLETLLALARDDSVGSAGAVLLADAFDA